MDPRTRSLRWCATVLLGAAAVAAAATPTSPLTVLATPAFDGGPADSSCDRGSVTSDGRWAATWTAATNLFATPGNAEQDIVVRDLRDGVNVLASPTVAGAEADWQCRYPSISDDGRWVVFESVARNLVAGNDTAYYSDVFLRDTVEGTTTLLTPGYGGGYAAGSSHTYGRAISADGRRIAFHSFAWNLLESPSDGNSHVYLRERETGVLRALDVAPDGAPGNANAYVPSLSPNGRWVAFVSDATNLAPDAGESGGTGTIYLHDTVRGTLEIVSRGLDGAPVGSCFEPVVSDNGRFVAFSSGSPDLVENDGNGEVDVFLVDRRKRTTIRVSEGPAALEGTTASYGPSLSANGKVLVFQGDGGTLAPGWPEGSTLVLRWNGRKRGASSLFPPTAFEGPVQSFTYAPSLSPNGRWLFVATSLPELLPERVDPYQVDGYVVRLR